MDLFMILHLHKSISVVSSFLPRCEVEFFSKSAFCAIFFNHFFSSSVVCKKSFSGSFSTTGCDKLSAYNAATSRPSPA